MKLTKFPTTRLTRERPLSEDQCGSVASLLRTVREMKLTKFPTTRLTRERPLSEDQCGSVASLLCIVWELNLIKFPTTRLTRERSPTLPFFFPRERPLVSA
jgi:hypothetical protein